MLTNDNDIILFFLAISTTSIIKQSFLPSCNLNPRPMICSNNILDLVGLANIIVSTDVSSNPVVKIDTFTKTLISPL